MKTAQDLLNEPSDDPKAIPDPPVSHGMDILCTLDGKQLQIVTRTNASIVEGIRSAGAFVARYHSDYISETQESLMRLAVSSGGKGRTEMIEIVKAGGQMPDAYYGDPKASRYNVPVPTVNDL